MNNEYYISKIKIEDLDEIVKIENTLFKNDDPWQITAFLAEISQPYNQYFTLKLNDNTIIGYGGIAIFPDKIFTGRSEIQNIGIAKRYQGKGYGKILLNHLLQIADKHNTETFLEVRTDNINAISLYKKLNFNIIGKRKNYYSKSNMDAYTMKRDIQK